MIQEAYYNVGCACIPISTRHYAHDRFVRDRAVRQSNLGQEIKERCENTLQGWTNHVQGYSDAK